MQRKKLTFGGLLALAVLLPLWWLGGMRAPRAVASCGGYLADWSDAAAFQPGCLDLGPPPLAAPPPGDPVTQWTADASRVNLNDSL